MSFIRGNFGVNVRDNVERKLESVKCFNKRIKIRVKRMRLGKCDIKGKS